MYVKGDIQIITEEIVREIHWLDSEDNPADYVRDNRSELEIKLPLVALPHSCSEWVIGGSKEVRQLIEDLKEALQQLETM